MTDDLQTQRVVRTVGEFSLGLARWFKKQAAFKAAALSGEVSGLKTITNGHLTFTLKDRDGVLECIVWSSRVTALIPIANGMSVIAVGDVTLRSEHSSYQLIVDSIEHTGIGELYARFQRLKEQFRREGLFDEARKRKITAFVRRVALVSAKGSKASEDFLATIRAKVPFVKVEFVATRVQGFGAENEIVAALDAANAMNVDVIVLTRGGGSYEDLFTFNEQTIVRAIGSSRLPVVTAIGHQDDHHLADEVADMSYGTPSKAAEAIADPWNVAKRRIAVASRDLQRAVENRVGTGSQSLASRSSLLAQEMHAMLNRAEKRLGAIERRLNAHNPSLRLLERKRKLGTLAAKLDAWPARAFDRRAREIETRKYALQNVYERMVRGAAHALDVVSARLRSSDPDAPLSRGYAIVLYQGRSVRSAAELGAGDMVTARLGHGTIEARVERAESDDQ